MSNQDSRATVPIGISGIVELDLVPRLKIEFDKLDEKSHSDFGVSIPIKGRCDNITKDVPCDVAWVVTRDKETVTGPYKPGVIKVNGNKFHIETNNTTPLANIIKDGLFGTGFLGCRVRPTFPHAGEFDTPEDKCWKFEYPLDIDIDKPESVKFGSKVVCKPRYHEVFDKADISLELFEADRDENTPKDEDDHIAVLRWHDGDRTARQWLVGFVTGDDSGQHLYFEKHETGDYEFGYRVRLGYRPKPEEFVDAVYLERPHEFVRVKKPRLKKFELEFPKQGTWRLRDSVTAVVEIANLAPDCSIPMELALVHHLRATKEPVGKWPAVTVSAKLEDEGVFKATLFAKWFWSSEAVPDAESVFAILSLRPAMPWVTPTPTCHMIDFDDDTFPAFEGNYFSHKYNATWVCSREAKKGVKTATELLADSGVKRVLYANGKEDANIQVFFGKLLAGEVERRTTPKKNACSKPIARALQRALVFLGYPTTSAGSYVIDGGFGKGSNKAYAYFLKEHAEDLLQDEEGKHLAEDDLLSRRGLAGDIPTVPVDKEGFEVLILSLNLAIKRRYIWFRDLDAATRNLDAIETKAKGLSITQILQTYRNAINEAVKYGAESGFEIKPQWLVALITSESEGRFRLHLDNDALHKYFEKKTPGGIFGADGMANIMECRLRSTRFGLGNRMGSDCSFTKKAKSAFDLFYGSTNDLVCWIVDILLDKKEECRVVEKVENVTTEEVVKLSKAYRGITGHHGKLLASFNEAKKEWVEIQ